MAVLLYWHTLRHLKGGQLVARAAKRFRRIDLVAPSGQSRRPFGGPIGIEPWRACALAGDGNFTFLNETRRIVGATDWNSTDVPKLWLYNLHYFDWINARQDAGASRDVAAAWMQRWIGENPPAKGNGWEPYPLSLRIVNWIKWLAHRPAVDPETADAIARSLELQAHVLSQRLETDLLGNHLFANAKALLFAGSYFEGRDADAWFERGARVLSRELGEQVLPDGGYFEPSPMYHSIILEDVLDLIALQQACPAMAWAGSGLQLPRLQRIAEAMLGWLDAMTHPDGRIALFGDAAFGIAPEPAKLKRYAERVGVVSLAPCRAAGIRTLGESGYLRVDRGAMSAILDVARIGPDHVPGHGHADVLSFEWSLGEQRVVVDSGTSVYGESRERLRQRGTAAHNTVVVDGEDSSEVWKGFRVARRAYPHDVVVDTSRERWTVSAAHDGYRRLPGRVMHRRLWAFGPESLRVADLVEGEHRTAHARFHFHPRVEIELRQGREGRLGGLNGWNVGVAVEKGRAWLEDSTWHPEFGRSLRNRCLVVELERGESVVSFEF